MQKFKFVIVTGLSGAGKTQVIHVFEDLGFFCIDNLLPDLIPEFIQICQRAKDKLLKVAIVVDIRGRIFFGELHNVLYKLDDSGFKYEILFLEASNSVIIKRFKETRREHPLGGNRAIEENIKLERSYLEQIRGKAKKVIDTSNLGLKEFKEEIISGFLKGEKQEKINFNITAFGYKYGLPQDADLVFDVRFLPNPFYVTKLKPYSGENQRVKNFILKSKKTKDFLKSLFLFIKQMIPFYLSEDRVHVDIAIGCTGGRHRSVVISHELKKCLLKQNHKVNIVCRDINKE
ncbi:MAG: RNase adapter RapZ [bacterium]